jgi:hypothetical protein
MASIACESVHNNDIKTQFVTREGYYKLMTSAEYSRPNRLGYTTQTNNTAVKVSFVTTINSSGDNGNGGNSSPNSSTTDRICFNVGRELYVYTYKGVKKVFILLIIALIESQMLSINIEINFVIERPRI